MNATPAPEPEDAAAASDDGNPSYAYKPNLVGAPWEFSLAGEGLAWRYGRRSGLIRYGDIRRVRLSFRPATLQSYRFLTEIWAPQSPRIQISSTTFRSLMEQARQDAAYRDFVTELHRRLAAAGTPALFQAGMHPALYWLGVGVFATIGLTLGGLLVRTLLNGDLTGAAVIVGVILLFLWQVGMVFRRNRPGIYRPDALPALVLPRA